MNIKSHSISLLSFIILMVNVVFSANFMEFNSNQNCNGLDQQACQDTSDCGWGNGYCSDWCDDCECAMYSQESDCWNHGNENDHACYWEDGLCHDEDGGMPECMANCQGVENIDSFETLCDWYDLDTTHATSCTSDCDDEFKIWLEICSYCEETIPDGVVCNPDEDNRLMGPEGLQCDDPWWENFTAAFGLHGLGGHDGNPDDTTTPTFCLWNQDANRGFFGISEYGTPDVANGCNPGYNQPECGAYQMELKINEKIGEGSVSAIDWWGPKTTFKPTNNECATVTTAIDEYLNAYMANGNGMASGNDCYFLDPGIECNDDEFKCHDGSACIPHEGSNKKTCDGVMDCADGSDECHDGCYDMCDQASSNDEEMFPSCAASCFTDASTDPFADGATAFCHWITEGDSCFSGCVDDEMREMESACDYCLSSAYDNTCEMLFDDDEDKDKDDDEGPPACLDDCHDGNGYTIFHYLNDDGSPMNGMTEICTHITDIWEDGTYSGIDQNDATCNSDCSPEEIGMISFYDYMCEGCLGDASGGDADSCEGWLGKDDDCKDYTNGTDCDSQNHCYWNDHDQACNESDDCHGYSQSECNDQGSCNWDDHSQECHEYYMDCEQLNDDNGATTDCSNTEGCYVNDDNYCKENDWPSCLSGCEGIENISPEDPIGFCEWITGNQMSTCPSNCNEEILFDLASFSYACTGCLAEDPTGAMNTCDEWLRWLDDDDGKDDHDYCNDYSQDECTQDNGCHWDEHDYMCYSDHHDDDYDADDPPYWYGTDVCPDGYEGSLDCLYECSEQHGTDLNSLFEATTLGPICEIIDAWDYNNGCLSECSNNPCTDPFIYDGIYHCQGCMMTGTCYEIPFGNSGGDDGGGGEWVIDDSCMKNCSGFEEINGTCTSFGGTDPSATCIQDACNYMAGWEESGCLDDCEPNDNCADGIVFFDYACEEIIADLEDGQINNCFGVSDGSGDYKVGFEQCMEDSDFDWDDCGHFDDEGPPICLDDCASMSLIFGMDDEAEWNETQMCHYIATWADPEGCMSDCDEELKNEVFSFAGGCVDCTFMDAYIPGVFSNSCENALEGHEDWICVDSAGGVSWLDDDGDDFDSQYECEESCAAGSTCTDEVYYCWEPMDLNLCDGTADENEDSDEDWYCCSCNCKDPDDGDCLASDQECIDNMGICYNQHYQNPHSSMSMCEEDCNAGNDLPDGTHCGINTDDFTCPDWEIEEHCSDNGCTWSDNGCYDCLGDPATIPCLDSCDLSVFNATIENSEDAHHFCAQIMDYDWSCANGCVEGCNPISNLENTCNDCMGNNSCDDVITMGYDHDHGDGGPPACVLDCEGFGIEPEDPGFCDWFNGLGGMNASCLSDCNQNDIDFLSNLTNEVCYGEDDHGDCYDDCFDSTGTSFPEALYGFNDEEIDIMMQFLQGDNPDLSGFDEEVIQMLTALAESGMGQYDMDLENLLGDPNITGACTWMIDVVAANGTCLNDCNSEDLAEIEFFNHMCTGCLAADTAESITGHCESWLGNEDFCHVYDDDLAACGNSPDCEIDEKFDPMTGMDMQVCSQIHTDCGEYIYSTEATCSQAYGCHWNNEAGECHHGPPSCLDNCEGIHDVDPGKDADGFCSWVSTADMTCAASCDPNFLQQLEGYGHMCAGCMDNAANDCQDWFDMLDDDGGDEFCGDGDCNNGEDHGSCPMDCHDDWEQDHSDCNAFNEDGVFTGNVMAWHEHHINNGYDQNFFGIDGALYDEDPSLFASGNPITIQVDAETSYDYIINHVAFHDPNDNIHYVYINNHDGTAAFGWEDGWILYTDDTYSLMPGMNACNEAWNCHWHGFLEHCFDHEFNWEYFDNNPDCHWDFLDDEEACHWAGCNWTDQNECTNASCDSFNSNNDAFGCANANGCWWDGWLEYCYQEGEDAFTMGCDHEAINSQGKCEAIGCTWENEMCGGEMQGGFHDDSGPHAIGGLNQVLIKWPSDSTGAADSYNIIRNGEYACNLNARCEDAPHEEWCLKDGCIWEDEACSGTMPDMMSYWDAGSTCHDETGWGLGFDTEYCYEIQYLDHVLDSDGISIIQQDIIHSLEICATTLPQVQAFLQLDVSLANAKVAKEAYIQGTNPFGDLTGDGEIDGIIMVKMVNLLPVDGYQFDFNLTPGIVKVVTGHDGTSLMSNGNHGLEIHLGPLNENNMYEPTNDGMIMGFDMAGQNFIPEGFPGNPHGNEGNLLAVLVLGSEGGPMEDVTATISNFIVSGKNPFTWESIALNACDSDMDPLNGCFETATFEPYVDYDVPECLMDCAGIENVANSEDGSEICLFLNPIWGVDGSCTSDCMDEDYDQLTLFSHICDGCLALDASGGACTAWFDEIFDNNPCKELSQEECASQDNNCHWDDHECYEDYHDDAENDVDCEQYNQYNDGGDLQIGSFYEGGYVFELNNDGTVLLADLSDLDELSTQAQAENACEALTSNGHDDWYLPSADNLTSIFNSLSSWGSHPTSEFNEGNSDINRYWSSSFAPAPNNNPMVLMFSPNQVPIPWVPWSNFNVRCIRSSNISNSTATQCPAEHCFIDENGYCKDMDWPSCLSGCAGIANISPENPSDFCNWITGDELLTCSTSCEDDILQEIAIYSHVCTGCLEIETADSNTCGEWLELLDQDGGEHHLEECEPCEGAPGCGDYFDPNECMDHEGCYWMGWEQGPGCGEDGYHDECMDCNCGGPPQPCWESQGGDCCTNAYDCSPNGNAIFDCQGVCGGYDFSCYEDVTTEITDGCDLPDSDIKGFLHLHPSGEVFYKSPYDIGGFQFNVQGANIASYSGGDAAVLTVSTLDDMLMAFSMTGSFIEQGCGTLINLTLDGNATGLFDIIVSQPNAQQAYFEYFDFGSDTTIISGCMEISACNYSPFATQDDGSCQYLDCSGECGGDATIDTCGICDGGCMEECGCSGMCDGSTEDECGVCGGSNDCVHFIPAHLEYSENPYLAMNIYVTHAALEDMDLEAGDEIGVFDGDICVGSGILDGTLSVTNRLGIAASSQDASWPSNTGFTSGNTIHYRFWDASEEIEYDSIEATYLSGNDTFVQQASSFVELNGYSSTDQDIELSNGWNIISFNVTPDDLDLSSVLAGIIADSSLVKIQSETGSAMEYVAFLANMGLDPWQNDIGNMENTEGYYAKVNQATTLSTSGSLVDLPFDIALTTGWNIISYPAQNSQDAISALNALMAEGSLEKVQSETGAALEYVAFLDQWISGIADFEAGEGYYLKVNAPTTLTINEGSGMSRTISNDEKLDPIHFKSSHVGNPYMPMNIYITDANIDGKPISHGMEVGIFDGDMCVGSAVFEESLESKENFLTLPVSMDDPTTWNKDGYLPGNEIKVRIFDGFNELEASSGGFVFEQLESVFMELDIRITPMAYRLHANYPNPFNPSTTVSYDLAVDGDVSLKVYNMRGEIISTMVSGYQHAGTHAVTWNGMTNSGKEAASGVYFFKLEAGDFVQMNKAILIK